MPKINIVCKDCDGTGLYKGMAERGKCAVVCRSCNGTGKQEFHYEEFKERKKRDDIERVFRGSYGYVHDHNSPGGCTYEEWLNGKEPEPVKEYYCPYIWDNKGIGNEPLEKCKEDISIGMSITNCIHYNNKNECWREYQKERIK